MVSLELAEHCVKLVALYNVVYYFFAVILSGCFGIFGFFKKNAVLVKNAKKYL